MASFASQVASARVAHLAVNDIEAMAREQIEQAMDAWDAGMLDARTVRYRLERIVRSAYRASVAVAVGQVGRQAEIPGWEPNDRVFRTPYLESLLADVRANLRDYKASGKTPEARRRALLRMKHSAGVAAQRGHTDAIVSAFEELAVVGLEVHKTWMANYDNGNVPCPQCHALHGSQVGLDEEFDHGPRYTPYVDLLGPPAHPQCRCWLAVLIVTLDNHDESLETSEAEDVTQTSMTAAAVRAMPKSVFSTFITFLSKVSRLLRGKR